MAIQSFNPYTNTLEKSFDELDTTAIDNVITQADQAYIKWKKTTVEERSALMLNLAKVITHEAEHYAQFPTLEMGKLKTETLYWELPTCADIARYYAKKAKTFLAPDVLKKSWITGSTVVEKHPLGVIFGIMPWNYPYYQVFRFAIPNIMAGNTVIIKHASNVPQCALAIEELFQKAGFPKGVYTNVLVSGKNTSQIIADKRIQGVSLTGSETAGAKVAELAGTNLKKVVLELGGSDPFIVLEDTDVDYTTDMAILGRFFNSGQTCIASKRFIIHRDCYNDFLGKFIAKTMDLKPGNPMDDSTKFAPMSSHKERDALLQLINNAVAQGARLEIGGKAYTDLEGAWIEPTIISGVTPEMNIYHQELFGPVAIIHQIKNDDEAIQLANDSEFGLSATIFSKSKSRIKYISNRLETGMVFINTVSVTEPETPFGGVKKSGFGRELSKMGMEEFINRKTIRKIPIWAFKYKLKQMGL